MGSLLWTGPRRGCMLFYSSAHFARRVAGHRSSSVMPHDPLDYASNKPVVPWRLRGAVKWLLIVGALVFAAVAAFVGALVHHMRYLNALSPWADH